MLTTETNKTNKKAVNKNDKKNNLKKSDLARSLMPVVERIAAKLAWNLPLHICRDDLISAGMFGLASALERYDEARHASFRAYAETCIRGAMIDELRRNDIMSRDARIESKQLEKKIANLNTQLGHKAEETEIAAQLGMSLNDYYAYQAKTHAVHEVSLEEAGTLHEQSISAEEALGNAEIATQIEACFKQLSEREQAILKLSYYEDCKLKEIGETLGISMVRVFQIREGAIKKMKRELDSYANTDTSYAQAA